MSGLRSVGHALVLGALLTGCSEAPDAVVAPTSSPTGAPSSASTTSAPSTAASGTTRPPGRGSAADGDVDGDGRIDVIRPTEGRLTVQLSGSGRSVSVAVSQESPGKPGLLGSRDVDRDGFAEVFLETAAGSSTTFATPYRFDGTALHELRLDGEPVKLGIGGSVTHGEGFACLNSGLLEVRKAESQDGSAYTMTVRTYRLSGTDLVLTSSSTVEARQGEPAVEASYQVRCGSVGDGG